VSLQTNGLGALKARFPLSFFSSGQRGGILEPPPLATLWYSKLTLLK